MTKPLDYGTLKKMLEELFAKNDEIHSMLHPWLETVGEHMRAPEDVVEDWPATEDSLVKLLTEMLGTGTQHLVPNVRC
jgi:hypothetical protein